MFDVADVADVAEEMVAGLVNSGGAAQVVNAHIRADPAPSNT
ncbi:hypothetical protein ACWGHI_20645 [Streptomyces sp. NPDC054912]